MPEIIQNKGTPNSLFPTRSRHSEANRPTDPSRRTCFVISPIGAEGSPVRKHMDDVYHCLIEPACQRVGFDVYRGDHKARPGRITSQIIRSILDEDLIICVLTGANPNVYYELAMAESAGRPIVVLKLKDEPIPFDVKDIRIIEYDLEPRRVYEEVYVEQICEAIQNLEAEGLDRTVVPFAPELSPLNAEPWNFLVAREYNNISTRNVLDIANAAEARFDFCGIALKGWSFNENLLGILRKRSEAKQSSRLMMMHPDNPALSQMLQSTIATDIERLREDIRVAYDRFSSFARDNPSIEVRQVQRGIIYQQAAINDHEMVWTPHLIKFTTGESPGVRVHRQAAETAGLRNTGGMQHLLTAVQKEFDHLWSANRAPGAGSTFVTVDGKPYLESASG